MSILDWLLLTCVVVFLALVGAILTERALNDNYCKTIPIERMDKKRCGVE